MEDIISKEFKLTMDCMPLVLSVVRKLNGIRLGNKNKWAMGSITLVDLPSFEPCKAVLKYKMYNTWVQILELETTIGKEVSRIKDSSAMDLKPMAFKEWLKESIQSLLRSITYDKATNRLSTNS